MGHDAASFGTDHADGDADAVLKTLETLRENVFDLRVRPKL
jgi:hypothetical protein